MDYDRWCQYEFWRERLLYPYWKWHCWSISSAFFLKSTLMQSYVGGFSAEGWLFLLLWRKPPSWRSESGYLSSFGIKHWPSYIFFKIHDTIAAKLPVIDVDGVRLYHKLQDFRCWLVSLPLPFIPLSDWESVSLDNVGEMSTKILCVTPGKYWVEEQSNVLW